LRGLAIRRKLVKVEVKIPTQAKGTLEWGTPATPGRYRF